MVSRKWIYKIIFGLISIYAMCEKCFAQKTENEILIRQLIEARAEEQDGDVDFTAIYYRLSYYNDYPLDLNKANAENLENLYVLSQLQIQNLLDHRKNYGDLISIYELQSVEGFDIATIEKILPFVKVDNGIEQKNYTVKQLLTQGKHEVFLRQTQTLEKEAGYNYPNPKYRFQGSPFGLQLRYNYRFSNIISYGFTAEKDAGEQFLTGSQKRGFDFYSAHVFYSGDKLMKTIALGDYNVQFGQGLTVWSSLSFGKSAIVMNIARQARGIVANRGANEFQFFRGAATSLQIKDFTVSAFASRKRIDASALQDTFSDRAVEVSSLLLAGYHRNAAELEDRHTLREQLAGGEILYRKSHLKIGISGIYGNYNIPVSGADNLYSIYKVGGKYFGRAGFSYSYLFRNVYFFGEMARNIEGGNAMLHGLLASLHQNLDVGILYRNYGRNYNVTYTGAFGESAVNTNEKGTYLAISYKLNAAWLWSMYADVFTFPWLRYRVDAPSKGYEYLSNLQYKPSKRWDVQIRYRLQNKEINSQLKTGNINTPVPSALQNFRLQIALAASDRWELRSRAEFSSYKEHNSPAENGFMAFQDLEYSFRKIPLKLSARYVFFDIAGYNARIYTYEDDVRFAYSVPALQAEGIRYYLLAQYRIKRNFILYARIARTQLYNQQTISSGLTKINAPHRTELKLQLQYSF